MKKKQGTPYIFIPLSQGKQAIIDSEDASRILQFKWSLYVAKSKFREIFYGRRTIKGNGIQHTIFLHREIMNAPKGIEVDHLNGDGLDCRKSNLRLATKGQNQINRQRPSNNRFGYTGVRFSAESGKYFAAIVFNSKKYRSNLSTSVEEAARDYDELALKFFGEFAVLNFPKKD